MHQTQKAVLVINTLGGQMKYIGCAGCALQYEKNEPEACKTCQPPNKTLKNNASRGVSGERNIMTKKEKAVTIIIRICPESVRTALKIRAAETGVSMQQIAIDAIVKYLKGN